MTSATSEGGSTARPRFAGTELQLWLTTVARVSLGLVMVSAGVLKISNPDQAVRAVQAYELLPRGVDQVVGYGLPMIEVALGLLLILGLGTRIAAVLAGLFMLVFIVGVGSAWARGLNIDCGCFGGGGAVGSSDKAWRYLSEILRDLLFLGLASWAAVLPASRFALDRRGIAGQDDYGLVDELEDDELEDDELEDDELEHELNDTNDDQTDHSTEEHLA